jgi:3-phenylpropionate/cinnamic acid dioxygenase small subunit
VSELIDIAERQETVFRCTQFVLAEADLLDERRLDSWTDLFADDAVYWLPIDADQREIGDGLNLILDDRLRLLDRVARLHTGLAFSDEPHSRTSHVIAGVRVLSAAEAVGLTGGRVVASTEHVVTARMVVGRTRQSETDTFHARVTWILRAVQDTFVIAMKRVDLLNARDPLPVLAFIL